MRPTVNRDTVNAGSAGRFLQIKSNSCLSGFRIKLNGKVCAR